MQSVDTNNETLIKIENGTDNTGNGNLEADAKPKTILDTSSNENNDSMMIEEDEPHNQPVSEPAEDPEEQAKNLLAALTADKSEAAVEQQATGSTSDESEHASNQQKNSSSISPGGSAFTNTSGVATGTSSCLEPATWFPSKLHQLLALFDHSDYKDCKWNFSTAGQGLQVTLFWQHKSCLEEPAMAYNCFTQVADCKDNLSEFVAKPKNPKTSSPKPMSNTMPRSDVSKKPIAETSDRANAIKNILSQYNKKDGEQVKLASPQSSEESPNGRMEATANGTSLQKSREDNLARLINGFQESLEQGFSGSIPPNKRMRESDENNHQGRTTPVDGEASIALASKALLAQMEKNQRSSSTSTPARGAASHTQQAFPLLNTVQNSKSSSNNIKDALEQLLSKRSSNQVDSKTEQTISASNAAIVVSDMLNANKSSSNTLTITPQNPIGSAAAANQTASSNSFDSMLNSSSLSSMLSNVQNSAAKAAVAASSITMPSINTTGAPTTSSNNSSLPGLNLSSILSGSNTNSAGSSSAAGSFGLLSNLNGMLAAAGTPGLQIPGLTSSNANFNTNSSRSNNSPITSKGSPASNKNDDGGGKESAQQRRVPVRFTADQKRLLYQLFEVNRYPKKPEREEIAAKIGVPEYAVHNFFSNTRKAIYRAAAATPGGQASLSDLPTSIGTGGPGSHLPGTSNISLSESLAALTADMDET